MNGNKKCSIKGCNYNASWKTTLDGDKRTYCICRKHKLLVFNPLKWVKIE